MPDENVCHFVKNVMKLLIALCHTLTEIYQILAAIVTMRDMSAYPEKWQGVNSAEPIYMLYLV